MAITITINTNQYEWTHGRRPRGRGYWAFEIGGQTRFFNGTYGQAKRLAVAEAQSQEVSRITVLP